MMNGDESVLVSAHVMRITLVVAEKHLIVLVAVPNNSCIS